MSGQTLFTAFPCVCVYSMHLKILNWLTKLNKRCYFMPVIVTV